MTATLKARTVNPNDPETHITTIEYTFDDESKLTIDVPHWRPKSLQEMRENVIRAGQAQWAKKVAITEAMTAGSVLDQFIDKPFAFPQVPEEV